MECPIAGCVGRYFGSRTPGVLMNRRMSLNSLSAFLAYSGLFEAIEYSDIAIAAKHSENT